jgi:hypothetical protein
VKHFSTRFLNDEEPCDSSMHRRGDEHRTRLSGHLDLRGDARRVTEHFAG